MICNVKIREPASIRLDTPAPGAPRSELGSGATIVAARGVRRPARYVRKRNLPFTDGIRARTFESRAVSSG